MLPRGFDHGAAALADEFSRADTDAYIERIGDELFENLVRRHVDFVGSIDGERAASMLERFIGDLETQVVGNAQGYGAVRWLWYLRRIPDSPFMGDRRTTLGYDRLLAESLSWTIPGTDRSTDHKLVAFPVNSSVYRHICRFIGGVKALSHLHAMYRRIGKGAALQIQGVTPIARATSQVEEAIRVYDDRHEVSGNVGLAGLGLSSVGADASSLETDSTDVPLFLTFPCEPVWVPVRAPDGAGGYTDMEVLARHALTKLSLVRYINPFGMEATPFLLHIERLEPVISTALLLPMLFSRVPWALSSTVSFGYFFVPARVLKETADRWLPALAREVTIGVPGVRWSSSYDEWFERIKAFSPSVWPLSAGGVVRIFGDGVLLDTTSMSRALVTGAELDRAASDIANVRAESFELEVQRLINQSDWDPFEMRSMRGRRLRFSSRDITNVDAIGIKGDSLLLVSCKSLVYDREYDRGSYRVIRNAQTTVDNAVADWSRKVEFVSANRVGDNYDFSRFRTVIGVVCTPFEVYSDRAETLAFIEKGLRACASAAELLQWLGDPSDPSCLNWVSGKNSGEEFGALRGIEGKERS